MSAVESETRSGGNGYAGQAIRRKEDPRLITGEGIYVDDIKLPGMLHASIVRSPEAHATITSIDASAALEREGVQAVLTGEDLAEDLEGPLAMLWAPPGTEIKAPEHWPLARGKVAYVGQAVAVVIGDDRYSVVDAAEDVLVELEPLPVVVDPEKALEDEMVIHEDLGTNKAFEWALPGGDVEAGLAEAEVVVERRIVNHRTSGAPIEPRGTVADFRAGSLTLWTSTQIPHITRLLLSQQLGLPEDRIRVIAPEVGGGFGAKLQQYHEETILAVCARRLGRPIKWIETRSEHMTTSHHGRDQIDYVRIGAMRDGTITGIEVDQSGGQLLDISSERALRVTKQVTQLPREFTGNTLTIYLVFEYTR